jgi:hypothetical protein
MDLRVMLQSVKRGYFRNVSALLGGPLGGFWSCGPVVSDSSGLARPLRCVRARSGWMCWACVQIQPAASRSPGAGFLGAAWRKVRRPRPLDVG